MERGYIDKTHLYVLLTRGNVVGEKILRILGSLRGNPEKRTSEKERQLVPQDGPHPDVMPNGVFGKGSHGLETGREFHCFCYCTFVIKNYYCYFCNCYFFLLNA